MVLEINPQDILNLDNIESVVRQVMTERGEITLADFGYKPYEISDEYQRLVVQLQEGRPKEIRAKIEPISQVAEEKGHDKIFTALFETVLNAYQHGNKRDPNKKIMIHYHIDKEQLDILVEDEGGIVDQNFIPFILRHREGAYKNRFLDFYEFSGNKKPEGNLGKGTSFMHAYSDDVQYLMSPKGGLMVRLLTHKQTPNQ